MKAITVKRENLVRGLEILILNYNDLNKRVEKMKRAIEEGHYSSKESKDMSMQIYYNLCKDLDTAMNSLIAFGIAPIDVKGEKCKVSIKREENKND